MDAIDNSVAANESREDFLCRNGLPDKPIIAMLAGSRTAEIKTMMPVLTEFAKKMRGLPQYADYQFIIAGAPSRSPEDYKAWLDPSDKAVKVLFGQTQSIVRHAEAAVVNSGTASLETALLGTPQVVGFICASRITYLIAKHIIKVHYISLGNLIVDRLAFRELIQDECNADEITAEIRRLIEDGDYRQRMLDDYADIRKALGGSGASSAVAKSMIEELKK